MTPKENQYFYHFFSLAQQFYNSNKINYNEADNNWPARPPHISSLIILVRLVQLPECQSSRSWNSVCFAKRS